MRKMKGYIYVGKELIERVEKITNYGYEEVKGDLVPADILIQYLEDLLEEVENNKEVEEEPKENNFKDKYEYWGEEFEA